MLDGAFSTLCRSLHTSKSTGLLYMKQFVVDICNKKSSILNIEINFGVIWIL